VRQVRGFAYGFPPSKNISAWEVPRRVAGPFVEQPSIDRAPKGWAQQGGRSTMISTRVKIRENLLVSAVNIALERELITLACEPVVAATFEYELGGLPILAHVSDIGYDEVSLHINCCPTELGREFIRSSHHYEWQKFGQVLAWGCLERRTGKYLHTAVSYHGSKEITAKLASITVTPLGFGTKPTKHGYDFHREFENVFGPARRSARVHQRTT
jgi:hypothetical protein